MSDFEKRLQKEEQALMRKIGKLYDFIQSKKFDEVEPTHQQLLTIQLSQMRAYWKTLQLRLKLLSDKNN